jgi:class 3 adenylate cyclase
MGCPNCGANFPELAKFCSQCGFALTQRCSACGGVNAPTAKFCSDCGTKLGGTGASVAEPAPGGAATSPLSAAERRQLTLMFCDLVGSTELSTRLEVEDLQELMRHYHSLVSNAVTRFGGFVARRVGDGVLAYFGYPHLGEDDAEQAVRAGLALLADIKQVKASEPLQLRIGIATGLMVVDEIAQNQEVLGEVPNLAARLQTLAEPNSIVIADSTRQLLGSLFEIEDLGLRALKGFPELQRCWQVRQEAHAKSRFEALRSRDIELVGREEEVGLLLQRWSQAKCGNGRVILVSADPGVGKSRLIASITDRLRGESHSELRYFCLPHYETSPLFPFIDQLERAAQFERTDMASTKLEKLEALLATRSVTPENLALIADLLSLPTERYPDVVLTPRRKKERIFEALLHQLNELATDKPLLVIFEDLHWMDPSSLELFDLIVERIEHMPVLLIATFRPEFKPPWAGQSHVMTTTLSRLSKYESAELIRRLTGNARPLSDDVIDQIVERAEGVPLFIEEVTKAVVETGIKPARPQQIASARKGFSVPPVLYASLMARLDRLGAGPRDVAQIGATIGRDFSYELLSLVWQRLESELKANLSLLVDSTLLFQRGESLQSYFVFKHALVQDAAYSTLLRDQRRQLHARVAEAIEKKFSETAANTPELVARHLSEAGLSERAVVYWQSAAQLALRRSAAGEALKHLSEALQILQQLPDTQERARRELEVRLGLWTALSLARGSSAPEAAEHTARAVKLARATGDDKQLFRAVWGSWHVKTTTGKTEQALPLANELFDIAERLSDRDLLLEAHHSRWATSHLLGLNPATLADTERGIALYQPERHHAHAYEYGGHDTGVCARAHRAMTLWLTGSVDQAERMSNEALGLARRLEHPPSVAHAAWWSAALQQLLGDNDACRELCELTLRIAREQGSKIFMMCPLLLGRIVFDSGKVIDGLQQMEQAVVDKRQRGHRFYYEYELLVFAEALLKAGEPYRAADILEEALVFIDKSGHRTFEAEVQRVMGECLATQPGRGSEAEILLAKALATGRRQGALSFELRAGTSLARIHRARGEWEEARDVLAPIYGKFTEGWERPDVKEAKALLNS